MKLTHDCAAILDHSQLFRISAFLREHHAKTGGLKDSSVLHRERKPHLSQWPSATAA